MREILFRAKSLAGEWIEGFYYELSGKSLIKKSNGNTWVVDSETVGQYTGLTDKNGRKIFEGDICEAHYDQKNPEDASITMVQFEDGGFWHFWLYEGEAMRDELVDADWAAWNAVIGNIHDNPELFWQQKED